MVQRSDYYAALITVKSFRRWLSVNNPSSDIVSVIARSPSVGRVSLTRTNVIHELASSNRVRVLCVTSLGAEPVAMALRGDANPGHHGRDESSEE